MPDEFPKGRGYKRVGVENEEIRLSVTKRSAGYELEIRMLRSDDEHPVSALALSAPTVDFLIMLLTKLRARMRTDEPRPALSRGQGWTEEP